MTVTFSILQMNNYIYFFNNRFGTIVVHAQEILSFFQLQIQITIEISQEMFYWTRKEGIFKHIAKFLNCIKKINQNGYVILYFFFCLYFSYVNSTSILYKKYRHIQITWTISRSISLTNFIFDRMDRAMALTRKGCNLRVNVQTTTSVVSTISVLSQRLHTEK